MTTKSEFELTIGDEKSPFENLKIKLANYLQNKLQQKITNRQPDFTIGNNYLRRWWIIPRNRFFNIYYHNMRGSDDDRALHDHMYFNFSFILKGSYIEHTANGKFHRKAGAVKFRFPWTLHRLEVPPRKEDNSHECWTLFVTGPRVRKWGFQVGPIVKNWLGFRTKSGWMYFEDYIAKFGAKLNH